MTQSILQFFGANSYPDDMRKVALPIELLAKAMSSELPICDETAAGLRKLLEAQDCFIRAAMLGILRTSEADLDLDYDNE